jgi:hypothetical protein
MNDDLHSFLAFPQIEMPMTPQVESSVEKVNHFPWTASSMYFITIIENRSSYSQHIST